MSLVRRVVGCNVYVSEGKNTALIQQLQVKFVAVRKTSTIVQQQQQLDTACTL